MNLFVLLSLSHSLSPSDQSGTWGEAIFLHILVESLQQFRTAPLCFVFVSNDSLSYSSYFLLSFHVFYFCFSLCLLLFLLFFNNNCFAPTDSLHSLRVQNLQDGWTECEASERLPKHSNDAKSVLVRAIFAFCVTGVAVFKKHVAPPSSVRVLVGCDWVIFEGYFGQAGIVYQ